jgi:hypothetical protein
MASGDVLRVGREPHPDVFALVRRYGLELRLLAEGESLPGSYWGDSEAGLRRSTLFVRPDTPLHSLLHELGHYVCMTTERRAGLDRDAGGDDAEECGVCYLQILLADEIESLGRERLFADMDAWGYSFRLGSTRAWFACDAQDARDWLHLRGLIDDQGQATFELRTDT